MGCLFPADRVYWGLFPATRVSHGPNPEFPATPWAAGGKYGPLMKRRENGTPSAGSGWKIKKDVTV